MRGSEKTIRKFCICVYMCIQSNSNKDFSLRYFLSFIRWLVCYVCLCERMCTNERRSNCISFSLDLNCSFYALSLSRTVLDTVVYICVFASQVNEHRHTTVSDWVSEIEKTQLVTNKRTHCVSMRINVHKSTRSESCTRVFVFLSLSHSLVEWYETSNAKLNWRLSIIRWLCNTEFAISLNVQQN